MLKNQIEAFIDSQRQQIVDATKALVQIPSVKGEPQEGMPFGKEPNNALEKALEIGKELGFITTNYDGYVGAMDFSKDEPGLDILAHLDVVPANPDEWTVCPPYEPIEKDGKLYGRGTADDKGPAVSALFAMKAIKELNIPLKKNVRLIVGTDEECGSSDIDYYYSKEKPAPATFSPDASFPLINVEKGRFCAELTASYPAENHLPKILSITSGHTANVVPDSAVIVTQGLNETEIAPLLEAWSTRTNQSISLETQGEKLILRTKGIGGHAAEPWGANNSLTAALELLMELPFAQSENLSKLKKLSELFPHGDWFGKAAGIAMSDEVSKALTISLNILKADESGFSAVFDSRTPICSNKENTVNIMQKNCDERGFELNIKGLGTPHHVPEDSEFIQTLLNAYESYTGNKGECLVTGGGTYVHGLENAVAFGPAMPGTENNIHGADEFAVIDHMLLSAKIFAQVIVDICG